MVRRRMAGSLVIVAVIATIAGCTEISVLSGPRILSAGDTATYVLSLGGGGGEGAGWLWVLAEVPDSWSLLSNFYTGTIGGFPVSGSGTQNVGGCSFSPLPVIGDGFQRICVEIWEGPVEGGDEGEMALEFDVADVPDGEFVLKFWFVASGFDGTPDMGPPAYAEINREPHVYRFAGSLNQAAGALDDNFAVTSSNDGRSVVLGGEIIDISVVDRDPLTGALSHNHHLNDATLSGVEDLAFAPDDQQAYGVDGRRLACFQRNMVTGQLSVSQILEDNVGGVDGLGGARSVAISEDGATVNVAAFDDDAVSVFDRDPWSGDLSFVEAYFNDTSFITGMREPVALAVSPDGANVYVAGSYSSCIVVFDRDLVDGTLTYSQSICGASVFRRPRSLAIAPDGNHVYSVSNYHNYYEQDSDAVAVFERDPLNGQLSLVEVQKEGIDSVVGLVKPNDLALSPDGRYVFVSANTSLVVFSRDAATGSLNFINADFNLEGGVTGMPVPYQIALSADGLDLFYGSVESMAVFTARSFSDSFESGDTSSWSGVVP